MSLQQCCRHRGQKGINELQEGTALKDLQEIAAALAKKAELAKAEYKEPPFNAVTSMSTAQEIAEKKSPTSSCIKRETSEESFFTCVSAVEDIETQKKSLTQSSIKRETSQVLLSATTSPSSVDALCASADPITTPRTPETKQQLPFLCDLLLDDLKLGTDSNPSTAASTPEMKPMSPQKPQSPHLNHMNAKTGPAIQTQFKRGPGITVKKFRAAQEDRSEFLLDGSHEEGSEVFLHVYEVGIFAPSVHKVLGVLGTGAYHVGVEVYGWEFSYGNTQNHLDPHSDVTGLSVQRTPRVHPLHQYCFSESLGRTFLSPGQLKQLLNELKGRWLARKYHTLRNNCVSFAEAFCAVLGVSQPPERIGALAKGLKGFLYGSELGTNFGCE